MHKKLHQIQKIVFLIFIFLIIPFISNGQSCDINIHSNEINIYLNNENKVNGSNKPSENDSMWDKKVIPSTTHVAKFSNKGSYIWDASESNPVRIKGLIIEPGIDLTLGRDNNNQTPSFEIKHGVIVVKSGSTLNITYFTKMENLTICVENNAKLVFNSNSSGNSDGRRNDFDFKHITINLLGDKSELEFDDAEIILNGNIKINGWTGTEYCVNNNPPASGKSGNIKWTNKTINICSIINASVLPIELYSFNIQKVNNNSKLEWITAKEWENSHFEIERSINNINSWELIGEVKGVGYSDRLSKYEFIDEFTLLSGGSIFYRIKQVDFNGDYKYSDVKSISLNKIKTSNNWVVYPNPIKQGDKINVEFLEESNYKNELIYISLTSQSGIINFSGYFNNSKQIEQEINRILENKKGLFVLNISWSSYIENKRIIIN